MNAELINEIDLLDDLLNFGRKTKSWYDFVEDADLTKLGRHIGLSNPRSMLKQDLIDEINSDLRDKLNECIAINDVDKARRYFRDKLFRLEIGTIKDFLEWATSNAFIPPVELNRKDECVEGLIALFIDSNLCKLDRSVNSTVQLVTISDEEDGTVADGCGNFIEQIAYSMRGKHAVDSTAQATALCLMNAFSIQETQLAAGYDCEQLQRRRQTFPLFAASYVMGYTTPRPKRNGSTRNITNTLVKWSEKFSNQLILHPSSVKRIGDDEHFQALAEHLWNLYRCKFEKAECRSGNFRKINTKREVRMKIAEFASLVGQLNPSGLQSRLSYGKPGRSSTHQQLSSYYLKCLEVSGRLI